MTVIFRTVRPGPTGLCTPHRYEEDSGYPQERKIARLLNRAQHPSAGRNISTTTQDIGYYAIPAARTCLNLCLVSLCLPSSSRFGDLLPTISYLRASQGRRAVKIPCIYCFSWTWAIFFFFFFDMSCGHVAYLLWVCIFSLFFFHCHAFWACGIPSLGMHLLFLFV